MISGSPKSFEYDINLEGLELYQFDEIEFSLQARGENLERRFFSSDTPERTKIFVKHMRHHILMQTQLKTCESKIYAEHYGQHDYYYRILSKKDLNRSVDMKNCGEVLMYLLQENENDNSLDLNSLKYSKYFELELMQF